MKTGRRAATIGVAVLVAGCTNDVAGPDLPPVIVAHAVAPNSHNVLSAVLSVRTQNADSVAVRFRTDVQSSAVTFTPAVKIAGDTAVVPILGLLSEQRYVVSAVAFGPGGITTSDPASITTGMLPADLPRYTTSGTNPSPGYIVFSSGAFGIVIDNSGRVVWYRRFTGGPGLNFMAQPNGHYATRPATPNPAEPGTWIELDPLGNLTRTLGCALGLPARLHDLIGDRDGGYWLLCDETRTMDLRADGGVSNAVVTGTTVQHIGPTGTLLFRWSPFDHFAITDVDLAERTGLSVNWTHGNALDFDTDGNLLVSFRNLSEITKINSTSGAVMWRMGGRRNQFTFPGSTSPPFFRQHGVRSFAPGTIVMLDNLGNPDESRAERYVVNEAARTATLAHSYGSVPGVVTLIGGSVQSLPGGRTLVSFGTTGRVEEYDSVGQVMWRIAGNPGYVFHAQRILSLYAPGAGTTR